MAIEQTPQTPQTLPTSKVGQAFHALKGALGLYIAEQEKTLRSVGMNYASEMMARYIGPEVAFDVYADMLDDGQTPESDDE